APARVDHRACQDDPGPAAEDRRRLDQIPRTLRIVPPPPDGDDHRPARTAASATEPVGCASIVDHPDPGRAVGRLQLLRQPRGRRDARGRALDRKSTRLNSSHVKISYAVIILIKIIYDYIIYTPSFIYIFS